MCVRTETKGALIVRLDLALDKRLTRLAVVRAQFTSVDREVMVFVSSRDLEGMLERELGRVHEQHVAELVEPIERLLNDGIAAQAKDHPPHTLSVRDKALRLLHDSATRGMTQAVRQRSVELVVRGVCRQGIGGFHRFVEVGWLRMGAAEKVARKEGLTVPLLSVQLCKGGGFPEELLQSLEAATEERYGNSLATH